MAGNKNSGKKFFIIFSSIILIIFLFQILIYFQTTQKVTNVIDGDTLRLEDGRRVRLLSVDAPGINFCMGTKAKEMLQKQVLNKRISIKSVVTDDYGRIVGNVYILKKLVSLDLVRSGLALFTSTSNPEVNKLKKAHDYARENRLGIYSPLCRQYQTAGNCKIKGNIRKNIKTYYLDNCKSYSSVIVDLSFGDQWFCTEEEAKVQGFIKASNC